MVAQLAKIMAVFCRFAFVDNPASPTMPTHFLYRCCIAICILGSASFSFAQAGADAAPDFDDVVNRGLNYLREKGQGENGTISPRVGSGITSLA
jgi:hypothetical protein